MTKILDQESAEQKFEYFASFPSEETALEYTTFLEKNEIPYKIHKSETIITEAIVGTPAFPRITIKLLPKDFKRVRSLVEAMLENQTEEELKSYYLNDLDNDELYEVLESQEDWSTQDVVMAKLLLRSRGETITDDEVKEMRNVSIEEQHEGKYLSGWEILSYVALLIGCLFVSQMAAVLGGIGMSLYIWKGKKVDIEGMSHYIYDEPSRTTGFWFLMFVFTLCVVLVVLWIIVMTTEWNMSHYDNFTM